ncbi:Cellulose synthase catalytic subunit [UDP-forming] [Pantoea agglomerans]|uniref:Cellulose synthase catalytic subunit [UDP-forming] n=1 Tax=Enterobacter agglomerans TaxID=549 RepID=A0A379AMP1_ENTAG|nr:Cellulose synthase catalytic subunit [UDP-forming] [Pantoea agglomerans]
MWVRDTVLAAQCIDYPRDKIRVYLLDDGKRSEFARFAADVGVGYITRDDNKHAKAGNLNHAMKITKGELICIFGLRPRGDAHLPAGNGRTVPERSEAGAATDAALLLFSRSL